MIRAQKSAWLERVFALYNRNLLKRRFHSLRVSGLQNLRRKNPQRPLIIYANHSSWWDGLVAFELSRAARLDAFVMMEEKQLKKLFLFRRLGAFSVARESPRRAAESITYAADLLGESPGRALWIFPQGKILPNDARPLRFFTGAARIVEKLKDCDTLALAARYEFTGEFKPEIFISVAAAEPTARGTNFTPKQLTNTFESRLARLLDDLKNDVTTQNLQNYSRII